MKYFDIVPAKHEWERAYARLEYQRIVWHDLWNFAKYIEVQNG